MLVSSSALTRQNTSWFWMSRSLAQRSAVLSSSTYCLANSLAPDSSSTTNPKQNKISKAHHHHEVEVGLALDYVVDLHAVQHLFHLLTVPRQVVHLEHLAQRKQIGSEQVQL